MSDPISSSAKITNPFFLGKQITKSKKLMVEEKVKKGGKEEEKTGFHIVKYSNIYTFLNSKCNFVCGNIQKYRGVKVNRSNLSVTDRLSG